jgi:hypothetical protein
MKPEWKDSMAVDVVLWLIIAAGVAFVWCGCLMTADKGKSANFSGGRFGH